MKAALAPLALALALAGCAHKPPAWVPATSPYVAPASGFEVDLPDGWMRRNREIEQLLLTRDGTPLQRIVAGAVEFGKPPGIGSGKRPVTAGMSALEIAEVVVDDIAAASPSELRILENSPAALGGRPGFRVLAAWRDERGLPQRLALQGATAADRLYLVFLIAPERVYYPRDLPTFDAFVRGFRFREPAKPAARPAATPAAKPAPVAPGA